MFQICAFHPEHLLYQSTQQHPDLNYNNTFNPINRINVCQVRFCRTTDELKQRRVFLLWSDLRFRHMRMMSVTDWLKIKDASEKKPHERLEMSVGVLKNIQWCDSNSTSWCYNQWIFTWCERDTAGLVLMLQNHYILDPPQTIKCRCSSCLPERHL